MEWWIRGFREKGMAQPLRLIDQHSESQPLSPFITGTPDSVASSVATDLHGTISSRMGAVLSLSLIHI